MKTFLLIAFTASVVGLQFAKVEQHLSALQEQDTGDKICVVSGDPHISTFEGDKFDDYQEGEFVVYQDSGNVVIKVTNAPTPRWGTRDVVKKVVIQYPGKTVTRELDNGSCKYSTDDIKTNDYFKVGNVLVKTLIDWCSSNQLEARMSVHIKAQNPVGHGLCFWTKKMIIEASAHDSNGITMEQRQKIDQLCLTHPVECTHAKEMCKDKLESWGCLLDTINERQGVTVTTGNKWNSLGSGIGCEKRLYLGPIGTSRCRKKCIGSGKCGAIFWMGDENATNSACWYCETGYKLEHGKPSYQKLMEFKGKQREWKFVGSGIGCEQRIYKGKIGLSACRQQCKDSGKCGAVFWHGHPSSGDLKPCWYCEKGYTLTHGAPEYQKMQLYLDQH